MKLKKLLAVLLSVLLIFSSMSSLMGTLFVSAEEVTETEETAITESATAFLYEQAVKNATAEGATKPTTSNTRIAITQTGAWSSLGAFRR